jgi:hypothetical protein
MRADDFMVRLNIQRLQRLKVWPLVMYLHTLKAQEFGFQMYTLQHETDYFVTHLDKNCQFLKFHAWMCMFGSQTLVLKVWEYIKIGHTFECCAVIITANIPLSHFFHFLITLYYICIPLGFIKLVGHSNSNHGNLHLILTTCACVHHVACTLCNVYCNAMAI